MGKMKLLSNFINNMMNQVEGFCIVKNVQLKVNVKGAEYLDFTLVDSDGEINAKLWDYQSSLHGMYSAGDIIKVRATINIYRDVEQLKIDRIRHVIDDDSVDISTLVASAPVNGEQIFKELYDFAGEFENEELSRLVRYLMRENKDKLMSYPAALKLHHASRSGLMYHTHTMIELAKRIVSMYSEIYPELCEDLIYAGIMLHDIAKIEELDVNELGLATTYTPAGQMLGHIAMGMAMVQKAAAEISISSEVTTLVSHILLSHHGIAEYGSPKVPMFPEAEIVSTIDTLDARMYEMFDAMNGIDIGEFSERVWALDNRQIFRHGLKLVKDEN